MVKLAQHIEWSSPTPSKAVEGVSANEKKRTDRVLSDGQPRKTLAQLFESRAMSTFPLSSASAATAEKTATPPTNRNMASLSTSSSASSSTTSSATAATPSQLKLKSSLPTLLRQSVRTPLSSTPQTHVTFVENGTDEYYKHAHTPAAHQSSEVDEDMKRTSSTRKISHINKPEGALLRHKNAVERSSISGPLDQLECSPRSPLSNPRNSEHSLRSVPAKPSRGRNGRSTENLTKKMLFGQEKEQISSVVANLSKLEQKTRSPFAKFCIHEHNQINFLKKSIDTVASLHNESRSRLEQTDPYIGKGLNAVYTVLHTLKKENKVRKGLFGLLTDVSIAKDLVGESKVADGSSWKVSGNLEKATITQRSGGKVQTLKSPPRGLPGNGATDTDNVAVSLQTDQYSGRESTANLGVWDESRESIYMGVAIPDKMVGLAWIGAEPRLLSPGSHSFVSDKFVLEKVVSDRTKYLNHGNLHRVCIDEGHLGVAWVDGKSILLEAGVSVLISSSNRFFYNTTDKRMLSEKEFVLGPFRVVCVDDSEVGIKFCNRLPQILYPGRHCLSISKVEVFAGFELLSRRHSYVSKASAISKDNMKVSADVCVEWQIKAEDAAAARLANITDVEGAVWCNVQRAFHMVMWELNARDMKQQLTSGIGSISDS